MRFLCYNKGTTAQFGGASGDVFSAICGCAVLPMISVSEKHFVHFLRFHARKLEITSFFPRG